MRRITFQQVSVFLLLLALILLTTFTLIWLVADFVPRGDFRGISLVGISVVLFYICSLAIYRLFLFFWPLPTGSISQYSQRELVAHVNILFYLLIFNSLVRSHVLPVPLMRLIYLALGAKLGKNTYSAGAILDPPLTSAGQNCIIGHDAVIFSHAIEGSRLSLAWVRLGNNVTIGATAVIMSDVEIGDGSIISAGAVVRKGTRIPAAELWGGVPARRLKQLDVP